MTTPATRTITVEALAAALLRAVPGYGRWMAYPSPSYNETRRMSEAAEAEALVHAAAIFAALPAEPAGAGLACQLDPDGWCAIHGTEWHDGYAAALAATPGGEGEG